MFLFYFCSRWTFDKFQAPRTAPTELVLARPICLPMQDADNKSGLAARSGAREALLAYLPDWPGVFHRLFRMLRGIRPTIRLVFQIFLVDYRRPTCRVPSGGQTRCGSVTGSQLRLSGGIMPPSSSRLLQRPPTTSVRRFVASRKPPLAAKSDIARPRMTEVIVRPPRHGVNAQIPVGEKIVDRRTTRARRGNVSRAFDLCSFSLAPPAQRRLNPGLRSFRHPSTQLREYLHDGFGRAYQPSQVTF